MFKLEELLASERMSVNISVLSAVGFNGSLVYDRDILCGNEM